MASDRRHDLDALRVFAFLVLILYHVGMFYVPWGWHVKSVHAPIEVLEMPMRLTNGWRLPLLFFISGAALRFALDKAPHGPFLRRRVWVLLVPLLFGMYVICAPQTWHELRQGGIEPGTVLTFYRGYADWPWSSPEGWPMITPTWNHLWYLLYMLVYSVVIILASWAARGALERRLSPLAGSRTLVSMIPVIHVSLLFLMQDSVGRAQTLYGDWFNLLTSFLICLFGYGVAKEAEFWDLLKRLRGVMLFAALVLSVCVAVLSISEAAWQVALAVRILQGWIVIWALLGWAQVLVTGPSPLLTYLSGAIFTYYVLHQTVIIMVGVPLSGLGLPATVEAVILIIGTGAVCWAGYEFLARRIGRFGVLLGARN
ncbi:MAG: acyltransferase family protein [Pseudomonadota bacterium]